MTQRLHREIKRLNKKIEELGQTVFSNFDIAMLAFDDLDINKSKIIIAADKDVDDREIEIEEDCLKILALYQPVARDLRYIIAVLKINNDIERIGDLTSNICERALDVARQKQLPESRHLLKEMSQSVREMLDISLKSLTEKDADLARAVLPLDDAVDQYHARMHDVIRKEMLETVNEEFFRASLSIISISRFLERIADHSTNIAEDVIYSIEGDIIRHGLASKN